MKAPLLATIDIGSNSVLLLVGRVADRKLQIELQRKETTRLGGSLDAHSHLQAGAIERGLACLQDFAQRIEAIPPHHRRAVATQTLREAHNREDFLSPARVILGCDVELISGEREAALIYQGVSGLLPASPERRLVIDIGGRSTEICTGQGTQLHTASSCPVGSVAWAQRFFHDGCLDRARFQAAHSAAQALLQPHALQLRNTTWDQVYGSSGTAGAISKVLQQAGAPAGEISRFQLLGLQEQLIRAGHVDRLPLQGLREELRPVIGGGVSIMCAVFEVMQLSHLRVAHGALRHGVLFELQQALQSPLS